MLMINNKIGKIVLWTLIFCLIFTTISFQPAMATSNQDSLYQDVLEDSEIQKVLKEHLEKHQPESENKELQSQSQSVIGANQQSTSNQDLLQDPEIQKILNKHFEEKVNNQANNELINEKMELDSNNLLNEKIDRIGKSDRFIIKFKDEKAKNAFKASMKNQQTNKRGVKGSGNFKFGQLSDLKTNKKRSLKTKNRKFSVLTTEEKIEVEELMSQVKEENMDSEIEYIQPDYEVSIASVNTSSKKNSNLSEQHIDLSMSTQINDPRFDEQWSLLPIQYEGDQNRTFSAIGINGYDKNRTISAIGVDEFDENITASAIGIDAVSAWDQSEGEGVIVAVLDTGIDITHEDLKDNIWTNKAEIPNNGLDDDGNGYVDDINGWNFFDKTNKVHDSSTVYDEWHGTHIAGIIAAVKDNEKGITGVAPQARIMPLQVFKNGTAYTSDIIAAIDYAKENGAKIINCSWGTSSENIALQEAMNEPELLFICAAGNSGKNIDHDPIYPASLTKDNILSVASVKKNGNLSNFSNYGVNSVDVAAPGEEILSTTPNNQYGQSGGTSQATAFVAGEAALILSQYPDISLNEVRNRIINSSDRLSSLADKVYNANKINCVSALSEHIIIKEDIIKIPEEINNEEPGSGQDNGDYNLFSVDEWNTRPSMNVTRRFLGAVTVNGKIYAIGGYNGSFRNTVEEYNPITNTWSTKSNMPTARDGLGLAVANGKIYAIGGYNGSYLNTVQEYNPTNNSWTTKAAMPTARRHVAVITVDNKIYAIGGYNGSALNTVEEYNPINNTWTTKSSMPTARYGLGIAVVNGKIYAISGHSSTITNVVEEYNPTNNSWTIKANIPTARYYLGATAINGKIYAIGGYNNGYKNTVEEYNPITDVWGSRTNLSTSRYGLAISELNGKVYAVGGYNGSYLSTVEEYGLPTNNWTTLTSMPTARRDLRVAVVQEKIYAIGGYNGSSYLNSVEAFDKQTNTWTTKANMPTARAGHQITALNGQIYAIGGYNGISYLNTVEVYNPSTNTWTTKANMPTAKGYFGATAVNGKIYVVGGYNGTSYMSTVEEYDPITNTWTTKANMPTARGYLGADAVNDKIYVVGGNNGSSYLDIVEEYNLSTNVWVTKKSISAARKDLGVVTVNGKLYAIGGNNGQYLNIVEEYDSESNTWIIKNKENMTANISSFGITASNGKLYAIGGYNTNGNSKIVQEYTPVVNPWKIKAPMLIPTEALSVVTVNGKIYAIGGEGETLTDYVYDSVQEYDPVANTWTMKTNMITGRYHAAAAVVDGKIYVIGGQSETCSCVNTVEQYDPLTDTWTTKANMPTARYDLAAVAINGKIYAIGGYDNGYINKVEEYNPITDTWTTKANMLTARCNLAAVASNGKIYAIGGKNQIYNLSTVEEYNPATNIWTTKAGMPTGRYALGAVEVNGYIYAIGGGWDFKTVEKYDLVLNQWSTEPSMPTPRAHLGVTAVNGKIYAIGGGNRFAFLDKVEEYDTQTSCWNTKAETITARKDFGVAVFNNKIYIAGGHNGSSYLNTVEEYDRQTNTWTTKASMPTVRSSMGMTTANGKIYVVGGYNGNSYLNTVEEYNPTTNTWTTKANMTTARGKLTVSALNGKIYAIGGYNGSYKNTVEEYNPATNTWTTKTSIPTARAGLCSAAVYNRIYAIGGYNGSYLNRIDEYNPETNTWTTKNAMPISRAYAAATVVNEKIYVIGGENGVNNYIDSNTEYDPSTNSWAQKTPMSTTRGCLVAASIDDQVYAIGGVRYANNSIILNTVEEYSPLNDNYTFVKDIKYERKGLAVVESNGKIYAIGGENNTGYLNSIEEYEMYFWLARLYNMPTARKGHGAVVLSGKIFVAGGYNGNYLNTFEVFDIKNKTWDTKANMPTAREGLVLTEVNGKIYAIGGYNENGYQNVVEEYDPYSNSWTTKTNMPTPRTEAGVASLNGNIYVIGGKNENVLNDIEIYNPITNQWTEINPDMPTPRHAFGIAILGNKIYVLGGMDGNSNYLSVVEEFDTNNNIWTSKPELLNKRAYSGAVGLGEIIYIYGGYNQDGYIDSTEMYNGDTIIWKEKASLPSSRKFLNAISVNDYIFAIGGLDGPNVLNKVEAYHTPSNTWYIAANMPTARCNTALASLNNKIYAIGGSSQGTCTNAVEEYNTETNTWSIKANMPTARSYAGAAVVNGKIYVIGGWDGTNYLNTIEEYNPATNSWTTKASMPTSRTCGGAVVLNGKIYVISGYTNSSHNEFQSVEVYDPETNTWTIKNDIPLWYKGARAVVINGKICAIEEGEGLVQEYDEGEDTWKAIGIAWLNTVYSTVTSANNKIYMIGNRSDQPNLLIEGSIEKYEDNPISELIHLGEEDLNISGNFSRTYKDMEIDVPGFKINLSRTYNSRDYRDDSPYSRGWTFGFQGSIKDYDESKKIVRLPNGGAQSFIKNTDGTYTSDDSRSTLVKQTNNTFILTTKDQYTYGFDTNGWLNWMKDRNGNTINITVDSEGKVTRITDQNSRQINITYSQGKISTITDFAGRTVQYQYIDNKLAKVIDPMGKETKYTYNEYDYISEIRDHDNNIIESVTYDYSEGPLNVKISKLTDHYNNESTYTYDTDYRKLTATDSNGRQTITWFDSSLYPIAVQDPEGRKTITVYNLDEYGKNKYGEEQTIIDRNGNTTIFERDSNGNVTKVYHQDSSYKEFGYDNKNNKIWGKDENGKHIFYIYDANGINLIKKAQPLNGTDQYTQGCDETPFAVTNYTYYTDTEAQQLGYHSNGLLKTEIDPEGNVTEYTYDANGNVATIKDAEGKISTYTYNAFGWKTGEQTPKQYDTTYVYDNNGNLEKITSEGGETTRIIYDNMGRKTKEVSPNLYDLALDNIAGHAYNGDTGYRYTYYPNGMVHTVTDPCNHTTSFTYDLYGNVLTETKPNGAVYQYTYDMMNRITNEFFKQNTSVSPVLLTKHEYLILPDGKTTETETQYLNDTETVVTVYTYDYVGRLIRQDNPDGTYNTVNYNENGTIGSTTDERGSTTYYSYDGLNRLKGQWTPSKVVNGNIRYTYTAKEYDKASRLTCEKTCKDVVNLYDTPTSNLITNSYEYYNDSKIKSVTDNEGRKTEFWYDNDNNISRQAVTVDATRKNIIEYTYNHLNKPATKTVHVQQGDIYGNDINSTADLTLITTYQYDKNGNLKNQTMPDNVTTTYTCDDMDRQTGIYQPGEDEHGNPVTILTTSTYNWNGDPLVETDENGHQTTYSYDERGFLTSMTNSKNGVMAYYYDRSGRVIAEVSPLNYDASKTLSQMNRTEYIYDSMDRIKTKSNTYIDPTTSQWVSVVEKAYKYDANGNVIKELDALGYESGTGSTDEKINTGYGTEYAYDLADRNITVLDAVSKDRGLSFTTKVDYDALGRKISKTDGRGYVTTYTLDDAGNTLTVSIDGQMIQTNTYNLAGNLKTRTDGNGNTITYEYNALSSIRKVDYPGDTTILSSNITYQYDVLGNLKMSQNSAGPVDIYIYDNQSRMLSHVQQKSDGTESITLSAIRYDKAGNKRFITDGNNVTTENIYDELNRLIQSKVTVTDSNNNTTLQTVTYGYDANSNQTTKTDWRGNTYTNIYDPLNRVIERKDPYNITIEKLRYNHNNVQTQSYDAYNKLTQFTYDKNNRLLSTIDPLNHITSQTYDDVGNIKTKTDGRNKVTTYNYDAFNRMISVVNAKNDTTSYTYDLNGNMLTQTDGAGHITTYEYNIRNLPIKRTDHGGRTGTEGNYTYDLTKTETYTYYPNGKMATKVDRNGVTTDYTYDVHGRLLSQIADTLSISYTYDRNSNQLTMTDSTGITSRTYDELNRVKTKTVPNIGTMTFQYDVTAGLGAGQIGEISTDPKGNVTTKVLDKAGRLISVNTDGQTTTYSYYNNGNKHVVIYPDGATETYTYYDNNLLHTLINKKADQTVIDSYSYTYDEANNQTSKVDSKGTTTYTYDDLERLETVTEPNGKITTYTFDVAGNRKTETVTLGQSTTLSTYDYNEQNRLMSIDKNGVVTTYEYDNNGNQLGFNKEKLEPIGQGSTELISGIFVIGETSEQEHALAAYVATYEYNVFNQLIKSSYTDHIVEYKYNGDGQRVEKTVNGTLTRYLYEYDKVILEVDGSNNEKARNTYGTNLISREVDNAKLYYMYNGHGDVTALINPSGDIIATYYYDAFGVPVETTGTADNPIRYAGYQYDDESGLYYLNARYYDAITARFLTEDTYRGTTNDPLSLNLYTYCHNEPIMYTDPTGHWEEGDGKLSENDQRRITKLTNKYWDAKKRGDIQGMDDAHRAAATIRETGGKKGYKSKDKYHYRTKKRKGSSRTISKGSKGKAVTVVQSSLQEKGYSVGNYGTDGKFGEYTQGAVIRYQIDNNLYHDGIVGSKTGSSLNLNVRKATNNIDSNSGLVATPKNTNQRVIQSGDVTTISGGNGELFPAYYRTTSDGTLYKMVNSDYVEEYHQSYKPQLSGHQTLDAAGAIPVAGEFADGANGLWYLIEGDKVNAGLSFGSTIPFVGWGGLVGKYGDNAVRFGDNLVNGAVKTAKSVLKDAKLPTKGKIRFVPPEKWTPSQPLPRQNGGYIDKFRNIWTKGPSRTKGQAFEWDVQLSKTGKQQLEQFSRDGSHLNVSLDGKITHR